MNMVATKWTISSIKAANDAAEHYFFSRKTMAFFGDRVGNWGVWHRDGRVFIHLKVSHRGAKAGQVREFNPNTGHISRAYDSITEAMAAVND
jgi:hypothetical protein